MQQSWQQQQPQISISVGSKRSAAGRSSRQRSVTAGPTASAVLPAQQAGAKLTTALLQPEAH
jgi:hypothetical protein